MPGKGDRIAGSDTQMAAFLFGLARGATVEEAAAAAGMSATTLYYRRKRCAVFAKVWQDAVRARADAAAAAAAAAAGGEAGRSTIVRWHPGRGLMRRRKPRVEFDRERRQAFLDHFAGTCNLEASARVAGISPSPVYRALRRDPAFAEAFGEALRIGYLCMEAEALREQREMQQAYRIDPATPDALKAQGFERTMQLLREYRRADGSTGRRADRRNAPGERWTFDAAMEDLEKRLKAFGVEIPEEGAEVAERPPAFTPTQPSPIKGEGLEGGGADA